MTIMVSLTEEHRRLQLMMARGVTEMQFGNERVKLDSWENLLKRLAWLEAKLGMRATPSRQNYPVFRKG